MNRAMFAAATGMSAQQQNLDVISDNLANADVAGFKAAQATFAPLGAGTLLGTAETGTREILTQGKLVKSGGGFDLAIDGTGFFSVERNGVSGYTRGGSFTRAADGTLRNDAGWTLRGVRIPTRAVDVSVASGGKVTATLAGGAHATLGTIGLVTVRAPERLRVLEGAIFAATADSGTPYRLAAGGDGQPKIAFGMLERSNVSIVEAMMAMLAAQRAYEANAKAVQAADEMLRIANNIHRS